MQKETEKVPLKDRVDIDKSGIDKYFYRPRARSVVGKAGFGAILGRCYQRESFIVAKASPAIMAPLCYQGTCNTDLFNFWVERYLIPELRPGQVVILDNATFHKSQKTTVMLYTYGCGVIFLPPYPPDLNPLERFWANLKRKVRESLKKFASWSEAIDYLFLAYGWHLCNF
ncbi:transposase [Parachlamydia sp. AcF125]|uniref:transposase n=1 Tax=Parachlamydia sp. AcF125 TaxID=2795736 RepID=UPI001BC92049|nr:transposase [Parachlamydia sp. AcF125]MBS4168620.1 hypothetical protein [Parachlamydia sp. AcF125]